MVAFSFSLTVHFKMMKAAGMLSLLHAAAAVTDSTLR